MLKSPGFFITPVSGGAVPVAVGLIHAFEALKIPVAVYDSSRRCRQLAGDGPLRQADFLPILREELIEAIPRIRPSWLLALDDAPLDAATAEALRHALPKIKIAHWLVEAHETVAWWKTVGPQDDLFFSAEAGIFADLARASRIPFAWLPTACDPSLYSAPGGAARSGVAFAGTLRPDRAALFETLCAAGLPLRLAGRGLSEHPALRAHVAWDGWVDSTREADLYRSALVVPEFHAGAGHDIVGPRVFAAAGCGAVVMTPPRLCLRELYPQDEIEILEPGADWIERLTTLLADPLTPARGARAAAWTLKHHTYLQRAAVLTERLAPSSRA